MNGTKMLRKTSAVSPAPGSSFKIPRDGVFPKGDRLPYALRQAVLRIKRRELIQKAQANLKAEREELHPKDEVRVYVSACAAV